MELFGWSFSEQTLFFLFILGIAILMLVFSRNRKYNIQTIAAIGKELESALRPNDQTYTWLGGSVGFKAEYQTPKPLRKAEATVTMLSFQVSGGAFLNCLRKRASVAAKSAKVIGSVMDSSAPLAATYFSV